MPRRIARRPVPTNVLEQLREMIVGRKLQPGQRLPSERRLALDLGVTRPSIREATKALQVLDILDARHGDGTYIKSLAGLSGGWPSRVEVTAQEFDLIELLEVRKMIEPIAASLAAARRTKAELAFIEREVLAQEKKPDDRINLNRHDQLFHEEIMRAAGNDILESVAVYLTPLVLKSRSLTGMTTPDPRRVIQQHRLIYEAIRVREPDLAEQAMREHLRTTGLDLLAYKSRTKT